MIKFSLFESVLRTLMEKITAFLSQLLAEIVSWYQQATWRDRGIAGGGLLTLIFLLIWGISGIFFGGNFLENFLPGLPGLNLPHVYYIFALNLLIGLKVGTGISLICLSLFKQDQLSSESQK